MFHELGHATGHESRLARKKLGEWARFGSNSYGEEELVAEMCAAFVSGTCGIGDAIEEASPAYIKGWLDAIKGDVKLLVQAGAKAQKAADFILGKIETEETEAE